MWKIICTLVFLSLVFTTTRVWAFEISFPSENEIVTAGSTIKVKVNLGEMPLPFGVIFFASRGILAPQLDSIAPFKWLIEIPADYYGPLTLWAVTRRYFPIAYSWTASVTIFVVHPALRVSLQ